MRQAIALSVDKMQAGCGGPFGAVIVKNGGVIGKGWYRVTSSCDPTAHAEISAIRDACQTIKDFSLKGATLYTSCEPCPMCLAAIYWARLDKLWFAATRADAADAGFDDERIYSEVSKDWKTRSLPSEQGMKPEAQQAFTAWKADAGRTPY